MFSFTLFSNFPTFFLHHPNQPYVIEDDDQDQDPDDIDNSGHSQFSNDNNKHGGNHYNVSDNDNNNIDSNINWALQQNSSPDRNLPMTQNYGNADFRQNTPPANHTVQRNMQVFDR